LSQNWSKSLKKTPRKASLKSNNQLLQSLLKVPPDRIVN